MLTRPWQTHPRCQQISAPQRCGSCWANPGSTDCNHRIFKHIVTCFLLYLHFKCQHERTAEAPSLTHVRTGIVHSVELTITQEQGSNHVRNVHQTAIKMLYCPHTWQIAFYWQVARYSHCYYDNMVISVKLIMPFNAGRLSVSIIVPDLSP